MISWVRAGLLATGQRPGYAPGEEYSVPRAAVEAWVDEKRAAGIASILCLLAGDQLPLYSRSLPEGLLRFYEQAGFAVANVASPDGLAEPYSTEQIEDAWCAFQALPKPVLVHCSAGHDRTGRIVAYLLGRLGESVEPRPGAPSMTSFPRDEVYPFTAIVGQEQMRLALLLNAIDPRIGGVLIRGEKGTAKSTMARALAQLLPVLRVVDGCSFSCDPDDERGRCAEHADAEAPAAASRGMRVVELPANATEDRLAGTVDVAAVLERGAVRFQPGILAAANRGILYVDEVNLLADHLVDLLLDAAAMGRNAVEREGISLSHPARFMLIGTMNPEEGELRPQLLDRFGLCVDVHGIADLDARVEVVRRRAAFEEEPAAFTARWQTEQEALRGRLSVARGLLPAVELPDEKLRLISSLALELGVDGHRADIVIARAARALAAFDGHSSVTADDVGRAAALALPHRLRRRPFEQEQFSEERLESTLSRLEAEQAAADPPPTEPEEPRAGTPADAGAGKASSDSKPGVPNSAEPELPKQRAAESLATTSPAGEPPTLPEINLLHDRTARSGSGRRQRSLSDDGRGRVVRTRPAANEPADLALGATVRAAAARPGRSLATLPVAVAPADLRVNVRDRKVGATIVFIVDASGSMGARKRMEAAKGAAISLLTDAYQRRDTVALIAFRGSAAQTLLPPTASVELAQRRLEDLPSGGRTPLAAGLREGVELLRRVRLRDPRAICVPVLITDGRANAGSGRLAPVDEALEVAHELRRPGNFPLVLDTENDYLSFGLAERIADQAGARYVKLADLSGSAIAARVSEAAHDALAGAPGSAAAPGA